MMVNLSNQIKVITQVAGTALITKYSIKDWQKTCPESWPTGQLSPAVGGWWRNQRNGINDYQLGEVR